MPAGATPRKGRAGRLSAPLRGAPPAGGRGAILQEECPMQHNTQTGSWNEENTATLRELWDEGPPAAEIGRRLGITKNAVIGKAWRLDLPPRRVAEGPSPVPSPAQIMPAATDR